MVNTPQTWVARNAARLAIYLLLAIVLVAAFLQVRQWRDDAKTGAERIEARDATAAAASGITADLATTTTDQQRVEVRITADTRQLAIDLETLRRANPDLDHWLRGDIPGELRQLARERREARERLGVGAAGSGAADPGAPAPGRGDAR